MSYDAELGVPRTFAHEIEEQLATQASERSEVAPAEARAVVREAHGPPGPQMVLPPDRAAALPEAVRERIVALPGRGSSVKVRCRCGRPVQSFTLVDCRDFPASVVENIRAFERQQFGRDVAWDGWACDGCWTAWVREGVMTKSDWLEHHDAPTETVERFRGTPEDHRP